MTVDTPGSPAGERGQVKAGVADGGQLDVLVAGLVDGVEAEEREEHVGADPFGAGAVGHDRPGVDPLERSFGDDDRDLLDGVAHEAAALQMQPRGLGIPAILAAVLAGPFGNSW